MKTYKIDTGNSATGPCGFVAYVSAESPEAALEKLRKFIDPDGYKVEEGISGEEGEFTVLVYLSPDNVKITEVEEDESEPLLCSASAKTEG